MGGSIMKAILVLISVLITSAAQAQETPQVADLMPTATQESDTDKGVIAIELLGAYSQQFYNLTANTNLTNQIYSMNLSNLKGTQLGGAFSYSPSKMGNTYRFSYSKTTTDYTEIPKAVTRSTQRVDESYRLYLHSKPFGSEKTWKWLFGLRRDLRSYTTTLARVSAQTVTPLSSNTETGLSFGAKNEGEAFGSFRREFVVETFVPVFVAESPSSGAEQYILNFEMVNSLILPIGDSFQASLGLGLFYDRAVFGTTAGVHERNMRDVFEETIGVWIPFKLKMMF